MNSTCFQLWHLIVIFHKIATLIIGVVALAIPHWFAHEHGHAGLFVLCENGMQCKPEATENDHSAMILNTVRGLLIASQGINLFAVITTIYAKVKKSRTCHLVGAGFLLFAGCLEIAGLAVFTAYFSQLSESSFIDDDIRKGYCYAIAWVSAGISFVFGIVGLVLANVKKEIY